MCTKIDMKRPVRVRAEARPGHKEDVRPAVVLAHPFDDSYGCRDGILVKFRCTNGSDTVMVFNDMGEPMRKLHPGVGGFKLENVPLKKTFYLYEDTLSGGGVIHTMRSQVRSHGASSGTIGRMKYRLLKEVEVEL